MTLGGYHDLSLNPEYVFESEPTNTYDRFILHFSREANGIEEGSSAENDIRIYSSGNQLFVVNKSDAKTIDLRVLNMNGQLVRDFSKLSGTFNTLTLEGIPGIYVVRVVTGNDIITTKVLIQ